MRSLDAMEVELGAVVWLVEDTADGPRRTPFCECLGMGGRQVFGGFVLGDDRVRTVGIPDDGRRVEWFTRDPWFRDAPDSWLYGRWLVLDTETTGFDSPDNPCGIVELGAVVMQEGRVLEHRSALFHPGRPIDPRAAAVHGITDAMVASRPRITDAHPETGRTPLQGLDMLAAKWDCQAIVGYNLISFDVPILRRELGFGFAALEAAVGCVADPLVIVRLDAVGKWWKGQGRHKLTSVADRFALNEPEPGMLIQAHRAAWDCVLAGRVLWHLRAHLPTDSDEAHRLCAGQGAQQRRELDAYWADRAQEAK